MITITFIVTALLESNAVFKLLDGTMPVNQFFKTTMAIFVIFFVWLFVIVSKTK